MKLTAVGVPAAIGGAAASAMALQLPTSSRQAALEVHVGQQTETVQAAQKQLAAMPDIDAARVAEIKAALARGEISFDPQKLAGLISRHHGGRG